MARGRGGAGPDRGRAAHQPLGRAAWRHASTLLDAACGYAGTYSADPEKPRRAFTLSLTCHFIKAALLGERLTARGIKSGGGKSVFFARGELRNGAGELIGQGEGVFKYITPRQGVSPASSLPKARR